MWQLDGTSAQASTWQTNSLPLSAAKNADMTCLPKREKHKETNALFQLIMWWDFTTAFVGNGAETSCHRTGCRNIIPPLFTATSQTTDHNKCLSYRSPIYSNYSCQTIYSRDRGRKTGEKHEKQEEGKNIKRYRWISYCYRCAPPAGVNSDQRPFIIWCCQNIKLSFQPSIRTKYRGERENRGRDKTRRGERGGGEEKKDKCLRQSQRCVTTRYIWKEEENKWSGRENDDGTMVTDWRWRIIRRLL